MNYLKAATRLKMVNRDIGRSESKLLKLRREKARLMLVFKKLNETFPE